MSSPMDHRKKYKPRNKGVPGDNKRVILNTEDATVEGYVSSSEEQVFYVETHGGETPHRRETGPEVVAYISGDSPYGKAQKSTVKINLTKMTEQELTATKEALDRLFATAYHIVRQRDRDAAEALDAGDSSFTRIYRKLPVLFVREGEIYSDDQVVRQRSEWPDGLPDQARVVMQNSVRSPGVSLSERNAGKRVSENNSAEDRLL